MSEFWKNADQQVRDIAKNHGIETVLFGSGYPVYEPCVVACTRDALSGEGAGYDVYVYPEGQGYNKPCNFYSI